MPIKGRFYWTLCLALAAGSVEAQPVGPPARPTAPGERVSPRNSERIVGRLKKTRAKPLAGTSITAKQVLVFYDKRLDNRSTTSIELIVVHCTESPDLNSALEAAEEVKYKTSGTGDVAHYYIDRKGGIVQIVGNDRVANHTTGHNPASIGIELVNRGRFPNWHGSKHQVMSEPYTDAQIRSLTQLVLHLKKIMPSIQKIAGHDELDLRMVPATDDPSIQVRRRVDPGPMFPWDKIISAVQLSRWQ